MPAKRRTIQRRRLSRLPRFWAPRIASRRRDRPLVVHLLGLGHVVDERVRLTRFGDAEMRGERQDAARVEQIVGRFVAPAVVQGRRRLREESKATLNPSCVFGTVAGWSNPNRSDPSVRPDQVCDRECEQRADQQQRIT